MEQRLRLERSNFETRMAALNRIYNVRFAEQAAVLEDEQRRLEAGQVRLREALNETERLKQELRTTESQESSTLLEGAPEGEHAREGEPQGAPPQKHPQAPPVLDNEMIVAGYTRDTDERARVLSPAQIAQIRRKMQEKMAATRRGT